MTQTHERIDSHPKIQSRLTKVYKAESRIAAKGAKTLEQMQEDVFAANLGTHKLSGSLDGIHSCSCGYDCRVLFSIEKDPDTESETVVLLDVGNHDDVY